MSTAMSRLGHDPAPGRPYAERSKRWQGRLTGRPVGRSSRTRGRRWGGDRMARACIDPGGAGPSVTPMPDGDDGFGLPPGLDNGTDTGWDDGFDLGEPTDVGGTPDTKSGEQPWWVRLGIELMFTPMS